MHAASQRGKGAGQQQHDPHRSAADVLPRPRIAALTGD